MVRTKQEAYEEYKRESEKTAQRLREEVFSQQTIASEERIATAKAKSQIEFLNGKPTTATTTKILTTTTMTTKTRPSNNNSNNNHSIV